jgi:glycosyltransferase involved in cell wall biosynthesis
MAFSLPIIAFDCPYGPSELIDDGVNGYLVPMGDIGIFTKRISSIADDSDLRQRMGESSLQKVQEFSDEKIAAIWNEILTSD